MSGSPNIKTLVVGASTKPYRYAHRAVKMLVINGHDVIALGKTEGDIEGISIHTQTKSFEDVHTVSMYLNPNNQPGLYDYILSLNPKRIIFNPGAENPQFANLAKEMGIHVENACTLVLLSLNQYHLMNE